MVIFQYASSEIHPHEHTTLEKSIRPPTPLDILPYKPARTKNLGSFINYSKRPTIWLQSHFSSSNRLEMTNKRRQEVLFEMGKNWSHRSLWRTGLWPIKQCQCGNGCKSEVSSVFRVGQEISQISTQLSQVKLGHAAKTPLQSQGWKNSNDGSGDRSSPSTFKHCMNQCPGAWLLGSHNKQWVPWLVFLIGILLINQLYC